MLHHIALTVNEPEEIKDFYEEVLLFNLQQKFSVNGETALQIFNTDETTEVYLMQQNDIRFEIFISSQKENKAFSHICLSYNKAENIFKKAVDMGCKSFIKENRGNNTYFIWDRSGNMFEIKEITE